MWRRRWKSGSRVRWIKLDVFESMNYQRKYKKALWHQIRHPESNKPSPLIKRLSVRLAEIKRSGVKRVWRSTKKSTPSSKAMARRRLSPLSSRQRDRLNLYAMAKRRWWRELESKQCAWPGCNALAEVSPHHKNGRVGTLLCEVRLFVALCHFHHSGLHSDTKLAEAARTHGLLAEKGWWNKNPFQTATA